MADDDDGGRRSGDSGKLVVLAVLIALVAAFALANTQKVTVDFVVADTRAPLFVVLVATAVIGAVIGALLRFARRHD